MRFAPAVAVGLSLVFASAAASADPITIQFNSRRVIAQQTLGTQSGASDQGRDDMKVVAQRPSGGSSLAAQTSSFADSMHWSGNEAVAASWEGPADFSAESAIFTGFVVASPVRFAFTETFAAVSTAAPNPSTHSDASAFAFLQPFTGRVVDGDEELGANIFRGGNSATGTSDDVDPHRTAFTGLLAPGKYQLSVISSVLGFNLFEPVRVSERAFVNFSMDFDASDAAPTPEPASLLLLATGIAGLFGVRSRRVNSAA